MVKEVTLSIPPLVNFNCTNCANYGGTYVATYQGVECEVSVIRTTGSMPTVFRSSGGCTTVNEVKIRFYVETHSASQLRLLGEITGTHTSSGCFEQMFYSTVWIGSNHYANKDCGDNAFDGSVLRFLNTFNHNCHTGSNLACIGDADAFDVQPPANTRIIVNSTACEPA